MRTRAAVGLGMLIIASCALASAPSASPEAAASGVITEDIRDIRGPKSALAQEPLLPIVAMGAVILLMAGYATWRWRRNRSGTVALLPFEIALQQLDRVRGIMRPEDSREFGGVVSDIVRRYIERRFDVTVTQRTTEEFMRGLMSSASTPLAEQRPLLAEFLQQSDVIKFAGSSVSLQDLEVLLQRARRLVQATARAVSDHDSIPST